MYRCITLAKLGSGNVAPNPMVGAVLVYNDNIIGEGYHAIYGQAHAEVNCINSVAEADKHLIKKSILYVSLEPCVHFGKTPPCVDLILQHKITQVVIGCTDTFDEVNGKGIEKLQKHGVDVTVGILEKECRELNKRFFTFHQQQRPYVILKWAQTANGIMGSTTNERLLISSDLTNKLVHKWRSQEASILIGTTTAAKDNPSLAVRNWQGKNPVRIVVDKNLTLNKSLQLFDNSTKTVILNTIKNAEEQNIIYYKMDSDTFAPANFLIALHHLNFTSVLVEGGAKILQAFIDADLWEEARIIVNEKLQLNEGVAAPIITNKILIDEQQLNTDKIYYYKPS
jgi:diaminohydroxyphosphoribosylaminopyrimidine deaminase / 5-amino-6-(5-phosphoribosylamino)uracil reductase